MAVLSALAVTAAACGDDNNSGASGDTTPESTTTQAPQKGGVLTFAAYSEIFGLDPLVALGSGTSGGIQMAAVMDTIMRYDHQKKEYLPQTAESVSANADSTEWTIKLRAGIKFSDGTDYDAEAVKFNINRHRVGYGIPVSECATYIACPRNPRATGSQVALIKDVVVVDKVTLKVALN